MTRIGTAAFKDVRSSHPYSGNHPTHVGRKVPTTARVPVGHHHRGPTEASEDQAVLKRRCPQITASANLKVVKLALTFRATANEVVPSSLAEAASFTFKRGQLPLQPFQTHTTMLIQAQENDWETRVNLEQLDRPSLAPPMHGVDAQPMERRPYPWRGQYPPGARKHANTAIEHAVEQTVAHHDVKHNTCQAVSNNPLTGGSSAPEKMKLIKQLHT